MIETSITASAVAANSDLHIVYKTYLNKQYIWELLQDLMPFLSPFGFLRLHLQFLLVRDAFR